MTFKPGLEHSGARYRSLDLMPRPAERCRSVRVRCHCSKRDSDRSARFWNAHPSQQDLRLREVYTLISVVNDAQIARLCCPSGFFGSTGIAG